MNKVKNHKATNNQNKSQFKKDHYRPANFLKMERGTPQNNLFSLRRWRTIEVKLTLKIWSKLWKSYCTIYVYLFPCLGEKKSGITIRLLNLFKINFMPKTSWLCRRTSALTSAITIWHGFETHAVGGWVWGLIYPAPPCPTTVSLICRKSRRSRYCGRVLANKHRFATSKAF